MNLLEALEKLKTSTNAMMWRTNSSSEFQLHLLLQDRMIEMAKLLVKHEQLSNTYAKTAEELMALDDEKLLWSERRDKLIAELKECLGP